MFRTDGGYGVPGMPGNSGQFLVGNPFGPQFAIPNKNPVGQPLLPGENKQQVEGVYGTPGPKPMPAAPPLGLPMAFGSSNLQNALPGAPGNFGGMSPIAAEYPADSWNQDDETLLKALQKGEMGKGPQIDKAIQDLIRQKSSFPIRGV